MISNKILLYHPNIFTKGIKRIVSECIHRLIRLRKIRFLSFLNYILVFTELAQRNNQFSTFSFSVTDNRTLRLDTMAPRKAPKATGESSSQNAEVISDTSPRSVDTVKT